MENPNHSFILMASSGGTLIPVVGSVQTGDLVTKEFVVNIAGDPRGAIELPLEARDRISPRNR